MSKHLHIMAPEGAIAETVLLPGDPLRAKFIAENFLEDAVCYNEVRGMYGYTGTYKANKEEEILCQNIYILWRQKVQLQKQYYYQEIH